MRAQTRTVALESVRGELLKLYFRGRIEEVTVERGGKKIKATFQVTWFEQLRT